MGTNPDFNFNAKSFLSVFDGHQPGGYKPEKYFRLNVEQAVSIIAKVLKHGERFGVFRRSIGLFYSFNEKEASNIHYKNFQSITFIALPKPADPPKTVNETDMWERCSQRQSYEKHPG